MRQTIISKLTDGKIIGSIVEIEKCNECNETLQHNINRLVEWAETRQMKFNVEKVRQCILVGR